MASKMEKELVKATGVEAEKDEKRMTYLARLLKAVGKLPDEGWEGLSDKAQTWYNGNADARNKAKKADKEIPDVTEFPDMEKEEEAPATKRRRSTDEDDEPAGKTAGVLAVGVDAKITTKKGKVYEGKVTELDDEMVVLKKADGEEIEISLDKIAEKEIFHGTAGKGAKEEAPDPLKKGAKVKVVTKRGKEVSGAIVSIDDDELVIVDSNDEEHEFRRDRVESITPVGGKAPTPKEEEEPAARGKGKKEDDAGKDEKARSKNEPGVSVSQVITELICDDLDATEEAIGKALKKKGVEAKENTLHLNYVSVHKVVACLKAKKLLKA